VFFFKKTNVKKINTLKKKKKGISREQCNSHCSHAPLFSEQWRHDTLFNEQCSMVVLKEPRKKAAFFCFQIVCVSHAIHCGTPYTVNNFFSLTKHWASAFLKKRNLYLVAKRALNVWLCICVLLFNIYVTIYKWYTCIWVIYRIITLNNICNNICSFSLKKKDLNS